MRPDEAITPTVSEEMEGGRGVLIKAALASVGRLV
jgi:hypothetical protein